MIFSGTLFLFQAEDGIRDLVRSRGLGDVYKRQGSIARALEVGKEWLGEDHPAVACLKAGVAIHHGPVSYTHLTLPTSDLV